MPGLDFSTIVGPSATPGMVLVRGPDGSMQEVDQATAQAILMQETAPPGDGVATSMADTQAMLPPQAVGAQQSLPADLSQAMADSAAIQQELRTYKPKDVSEPIAQTGTEGWSDRLGQVQVPGSTEAAQQPVIFGGQEVTPDSQPSAIFGGQEVTDGTAVPPDLARTQFPTERPMTPEQQAQLESQAPTTATPLLPMEEFNRAASANDVNAVRQLAMAYLFGGQGAPRVVVQGAVQEIMGLAQQGQLSAQNLERLRQELLGLIGQRGEIAAGVPEQSVPAMQGLSRGFQDLETQRIAQEQAIQNQIDQQMKESAMLIDRARQVRLDPNRIFSGNGSSRISAAIAVGVGAALQTVQGVLFPGSNPQNTAMNIINTAIERDIQAQMANYERDIQDVNNSQGLVNALRLRLGDNNTAITTARSMMQNQTLLQLQTYAMQAKSQEVRNQTATLINQLQQTWEAQRLAAMQAAQQEAEANLRRIQSRGGPRLREAKQATDIMTALGNQGGALRDDAMAPGAGTGTPVRMGSFEFTPGFLQGSPQEQAFQRDRLQQVTQDVDDSNAMRRFVRNARNIINNREMWPWQRSEALRVLTARYMTGQNLARISDRDISYHQALTDNLDILNRIGDITSAGGTITTRLDTIDRLAQEDIQRLRQSLPPGVRYVPSGPEAVTPSTR